MLFTSLPFLIFFTTFFVCYWLIFANNLKHQNILLLIGSYVFYAYWDYRFLTLLILTSGLNYILGIQLARSESEIKRKILLLTGIISGLGCLVLFKYLNFIILSFDGLLGIFSINSHLSTVNLILPLGISFYTFRTISYLLDVEKGKIEPVKNWIVFFSYVSFFPSIISGPIDKAKTLVPQLENKRIFSYTQATDGIRQILWGLFKKSVIADNCASITNSIFDNSDQLSGSTLILGAFLYTIQIYADFSGYSDMAIGIAKLIGFNITKNFDYPFFAQNIAEFWRKWHMSLTSWLTEYVFTPLSITFRDLDKTGLILSILINFTIVGIWHGDNWTFVVFGFIHGCLFIPLILKNKLNKKIKIEKDKIFPSPKEFLNICLNFFQVMMVFILFKAKNLQHAIEYYKNIFDFSIFTIPQIDNKMALYTLMIFIFILISTEWFQRDKAHPLHLEIDSFKKNNFLAKRKSIRWSLYILLSLLILGFSGNQQDFIYIQF